VLASNVTSNSTSFVNSPTITLAPGSYFYWGSFTAYILNSGSAGASTQLYWSANPSTFFGHSWGSAINQIPGTGNYYESNFGNIGAYFQTSTANATYALSSYTNAPGSGNTQLCSGMGQGNLTIASSLSVGFKIQQRSATDASNPAVLLAGSWLLFQRYA
jgi:hypothetical protein